MKNLRRITKEKNKKEPAIMRAPEGITLVALVVTIVVLLILAGITLVYVLGDNGVFSKAQEAKDKTDQTKQDEQEYFGNIDNTINKYVDGNGGTTNSPAKTQTVAEIVGKKQEDTITVEDANKNKITVPKGFTIVPNSGEKPSDSTETDEEWNAKKVIYSYLGDEAKTPTVQDGIVIEDEKGNQFVWVPVGTINNKSGDTEHGATSTITLGRYEDFAIKTDEEGNKYYQPKQTAEQYKKAEDSTQTDLEYQNAYKIDNWHIELTEQRVEEFLSSSTTNGGYYFARYEASKGDDNKPISKANQTLWEPTTMSKTAAYNYAKEMYDSTSPVKSDLVNSYAWDTAIIFIQTYSDENKNYANDTAKIISKTRTLKTGQSKDCVRNIHDMASNSPEWTTEFSMYENYGGGAYTWTRRGGDCNSSSETTGKRGCSNSSRRPMWATFREVCYLSNSLQ